LCAGIARGAEVTSAESAKRIQRKRRLRAQFGESLPSEWLRAWMTRRPLHRTEHSEVHCDSGSVLQLPFVVAGRSHPEFGR